MTAHISTVQDSRLRTLVVPREHGAWGMLLVPLVTGAAVASKIGINGGALALFLVAAMSLFWLRTPVESWLGSSAVKVQNAGERGYVLRRIAVIGVLSIVSVGALLWHGRNRDLVAIGVVAAVAFGAQAIVKRFGRSGRMPAQVIGAIGLTSTAAGAYYVATGRLDRIAIALWLANWLFAANQIHFVQLRIRSSRATAFEQKLKQGFPFLFAQIVLLGAILAGRSVGFFPALVAIAFLPILYRGMSWFVREPRPLDVHKLGLSELSQALAFGALLCAAFLL